MLVPLRKMWCLSETNIDGFFLSSLILQIGSFGIVFFFENIFSSSIGVAKTSRQTHEENIVYRKHFHEPSQNPSL